MLTINSKITIPAHVTSSFVDDDAILLNTRTNQYFALQEVSSRLWILLKEGKELHETCQVLESEYMVDATELQRDILEVINQMMESGLVELVEG